MKCRRLVSLLYNSLQHINPRIKERCVRCSLTVRYSSHFQLRKWLGRFKRDFFFYCHDSKEERFTPDKRNPVVYLLPHVTALHYQRKAAALTSFPTWPEGITVKRITAGGVTSWRVLRESPDLSPLPLRNIFIRQSQNVTGLIQRPVSFEYCLCSQIYTRRATGLTCLPRCCSNHTLSRGGGRLKTSPRREHRVQLNTVAPRTWRPAALQQLWTGSRGSQTHTAENCSRAACRALYSERTFDLAPNKSAFTVGHRTRPSQFWCSSMAIQLGTDHT